MNGTKTILKRIGFYYLLLSLNAVPNASVIPDSFPSRNVSSIYLLILSVCLVLYYEYRLPPTGKRSSMMKAISWMGMLLILLRTIKYSVFSEVGVLARHVWYLYYAPMLLIPLLLFGVALLISNKEEARLPKIWYGTLALTVVLIALVVTNDLHQFAFRFHGGFVNWDHDYSHGWLHYAVTVWQLFIYLVAITLLIIKCRVSDARKKSWIMILPFVFGIAMIALLFFGKLPAQIAEFPETVTIMVAVELECCMQLGLIPTNSNYGKLFSLLSISAQILDQSGTPVYASRTAPRLTAEQFAMPSGSRISEHTVMHKMQIPGGVGLWQDDLTQLDRLNAELMGAKEELAQEAELIQLRNDLKERQTKIEQRTMMYDAIAKRTQRQSQAISRFAESARQSTDIQMKEKIRNQIALLGAYIKRCANLMLISQDHSVIEVGELGLSVSEILRYLNFCGTPGELIRSGDGTVSSEAALAVFEAFEVLLESNASNLQGVFVNLTVQENVTFKLTIENLRMLLPDETAGRLAAAGVRSEGKCEDNVTYFCFTLPKGGAAA